MKPFTIQKFFVYSAILFGILFIILTPPFQAPDEDSHFKKAYVIANGDFFPTVKNNTVGFKLPKVMLEYIEDKLSYIGDRDKKMEYSESILDDRLGVDYGEKVFVNFSTSQSNPIAHIIPAIGVFIGKAFHFVLGRDDISASATNLLYFARFANLIFYTVIGYYTLKTIPILKKTMCCLALMPMSLFLASSVSYDVPLIATSFLAIAVILKLIFDDTYFFTRKHLVIFSLISLFIMAIKLNYMLIFALLFCVPKEKFIDKKDFWKNAGIFFAILVGIYIIYKIPGLFLKTNSVVGDNGNLAGQQISFILSNPLQYIKILGLEIYNGFEFYLTGTVGIFGLLDTYMLSFIVYLFSVVLFVIGISEASLAQIKLKLSSRAISIGLLAVSIIAIFTVFYITWTPMIEGYGVGATSITGVQGRYFIPLLPLLFICMINNKLTKVTIIKNGMQCIVNNTEIISIIMLLITGITLLLRFWI